MDAAFYLAAAVAIVATLLVVVLPSAVHALLYLVVSLLAVAVVFYVLGAPFAAALEVIVYAGAIMVLFLFIVMLIGEQQLSFDEHLGGQRLYAAVLGLLLAGILLITLASAAPFTGQSQLTEEVIGRQNVQLVGAQLYTEYLLPFEAASVLLLIAMIGAVVLAKRRLL